ncbi:DODA-type extradiol aromatic ring-opening family dioxygenase [Geobacillus subterraneus]|uniref:DODA-type extradiol aromatic ring-opening family dioxygenase n=1 Tax=Geobacillus subterraneus TaxID=129338 RepID=UPI001442C623|nr:class III extradiol ring-cleavage dioxygenase [Geobacillus subterraneus]QIZ67472.1 dioxygenase [Geobacillus subterraneus]
MRPPALFLAHGSPMLAIEDNAYTAFLKKLGEGIRPQAVVIFTAHWMTRQPTVSAVEGTYDMIYDFSGFPRELYEVVYPARGSVEWAERVRERLSSVTDVAIDQTRGLDHGSWVLLYRLFPKADIPVVQASVVPWWTPKQLLQLGEALRPLRDEGVMIIGSGGTVHNLMALRWEGHAEAESWAAAFDDWLLRESAARSEDVFHYEEKAPYAKQAVPTPEHLAPYWIAYGAGDRGGAPRVLFREYQYGSLSLMAVSF